VEDYYNTTVWGLVQQPFTPAGYSKLSLVKEPANTNILSLVRMRIDKIKIVSPIFDAKSLG